MKKSILALMLICYAFCSWGGQESTGSKERQAKDPTLGGRVADFFSKPISGAKIILEGTKWQAVSDEQGRFEPFELMAGTYTVRVTHPRYKTLICKNFEIPDGGKFAGFVLKAGTPNGKPLVRDDRPLGQVVIDEDAEPIDKVEPVYPESALKDRIEGTVLLNVLVNAEGEIVTAWIGQGVRDDLNHSALEAIQNFRFKPAKVKGKPVSVPISIPFNFKLADKSTNYPLQHLEGPLTADDVTQAFAYLGIEIERFAYDLPYKHKVKFWLEQYLDGKLEDSKSYRIGQEPGKSSILVLKHQTGDSIRYTINVASGNSRRIVSFGNIARRGYNSSGTQRMSNLVLRSDTKVPIYAYLSSPAGLNFRADDPLDQIIARIKSVIVISVELQLDQ